MKKMQRVAALAMGVCLLGTTMTVGLGGCNSSTSELRVMMLVNDGSDIWYQKKFKEIGEALGVEIDYVGYAYQDYDMQFRLAMQDRVPDVFYIRPNQIKNFVADGLLADMTEYIEQNVASEKLIDNFNNFFRYDGKNVGTSEGKIYAVNGGFSYQGIAYNKVLIDRCRDIIHDVGLVAPDELEEGTTYTWDEFATLLSSINHAMVGGASGTDAIGAMDMPTGAMLLQMIMNFGGDVIENGTVTIDSPQVKNCLEYLYEANTSNPGSTGFISADYSFSQWKGQKLAFYTASGSWEMAPYGEYEDVESGALQDVNVDFMPWPTLTGNYEDSRQLIGGAGYGVYAGSENLEMAKKIATWFTKEEVLEEMCYSGMSLPMTKELAEGEYLTDSKFHPNNKQFLMDVVTGKIGEVSPLNNCFSTEWYDTFSGGIDAVWNGNKTIASYISEKKSAMQELYDKYNK